MMEWLVLVDELGHRVGVADRRVCHQGHGIRHRAFVVFLFTRDGSLLVQKRTGSKLGGGRWDVSATSHVRVGESYNAAIGRCLRHELGITDSVRPQYLLAYTYQAQLGHSAENEHCSVFVINYNKSVKGNPQELDDLRWVKISELQKWFERDSNLFTAWFAEAFRRLNRLADQTWETG
jgi:isopentenyl-diphosphate delta-isomerase